MPNNDYILRSDALHELLSISKGNWSSKRFAEAIEATPAADVGPVVRCKDCKYKPFVKPEYKDKKYPYPFIEPGGVEIEFPDEENNPCPFLDGDPYGNIMPKDDFFCAHGARKGGEKDDA